MVEEQDILNKRQILLRLLGAGINITPNSLDLLLNANLKNKDLEELIREISFLSNFKSHLTLDILNQTKYSKLVGADVIKENVKENIKEDTAGDTNEDSKEELKEDLKENSNKDLHEGRSSKNKEERKLKSSTPIVPKQKQEQIKSEKHISNKRKQQMKPKNRAVVSLESESINELLSTNEEYVDTQTTEKNPQKSDQKLNGKPSGNIEGQGSISQFDRDIAKADRLASDVLDDGMMQEEDEEIELIPDSRLKLQDVGGLTEFNPIAKDYAKQIEVLKDPTQNLYTEGSTKDFYDVTIDKFNRLKDIIEKSYTPSNNLLPIRKLNLLPNSKEVAFIGMVTNKSVIGRNRHIKIFLDDPTGEIQALVRNVSENNNLYKKMKYLLQDQVVLIEGYLKVDSKRKSRIVFINDLKWPDISESHRESIPDIPLSIAFISDIHLGSTNFEEKLFLKFIKYIRGEVGNEKTQKQAGSIKYLVICGDLVDGIGVYPSQESELTITDIYKQYNYAAKLLSNIPDYINIIYIPGNHEPVRNALPTPSVDKKYCQPLLDLGITNVGNPSVLNLHGIKTAVFHGDSIIDLNTSIPGLSNEHPELAMKEYLRCRHLVPSYGVKTGIAPTGRDWLVLDDVPHILDTGHVHINGLGYYKGVLMVNSGCFQSQTNYMKTLGITPTPGRPVIADVKNKKINATEIDLVG
ncbi:MAG: hypothetical protein GF364_15380 [Candidatus Lokiarchaeota archaeon]|nr:hypothetical protein [Candidatus Lokiarchaeota archaeon]